MSTIRSSADGPATVPTPLRRRLRRDDLDLARRVHEALIPASFSHPCADVSVLFRSRDRLGGDYCQAVLADDRILYLTLCDVTGHGVASAMLASRVSMVVRDLLDRGSSPREVLERVDGFHRRHYAEAFEEMPLSFLACRLDLEARTLTYASAGHPGPLLLRQAGRPHDHLPTQNLLLGVAESCIFEPAESTLSFEPGDRLALFSDGVTDAACAGCRPLGVAGLAEIIRDSWSMNVFAIADRIMEGLDDRPPGLPLDDCTLLLLELY